jgi:regulator of sigma E protease
VTTILAFVFVLGVLIFVHELGHFLAAKRIGVRVVRFQLGFNPTVLSRKWGETEYSLGILPLGGYVKMAGENPEEPRTGKDDEFLSKTKWERFQVMIMGPAMNLLLAVVLTAVVLGQGADVPVFQDELPVVAAVVPDSDAARAGVQAADRIVSVNGEAVATWEDVFVQISSRGRGALTLGLLRDGRETSVSLPESSGSSLQMRDIGVLPDTHPYVAALTPGEPAERAGVEPNDVVVALDGQPIAFARQLSEAISKKADIPITLTVERDGARQDIPVTPALRGKIGMIGIRIGDAVKTFQPGPLEAVRMSVVRNYEYSLLIFRTLGGLLTGETSPRQLMGPVAIAQMSGESAQAGWLSLLALMSAISLNLGLLNLMPVPVLDGGHIIIMALEGVTRRDFSMAVKEKMFLAGFVLLVMLMVTVIYNDLTRIPWIENLMPWR